MIRLLLVDDHESVRSSIRCALDGNEEIDVVGEASDGIEALVQCNKLHPDVVLMDIKMPRMDGVEATSHIREAHPHIKVIALTSMENRELISQIMAAGAVKCLFKYVTYEELCLEILGTLHL